MKQIYIASYFRSGYSRFMKYVQDVFGHPKHGSIGKLPPLRYYLDNFGVPQKSNMLWTLTVA